MGERCIHERGGGWLDGVFGRGRLGGTSVGFCINITDGRVGMGSLADGECCITGMVLYNRHAR